MTAALLQKFNPLTSGNFNLVPQDLTGVTLEHTGFTSPADVIINYDASTQIVTLTGTVSAYHQDALNATLVSGYASTPHENTEGHFYWLYADGPNSTDIKWMKDAFPGMDKILISVVLYFAGYKFALRECHGLNMPADCHYSDHFTVGTYKLSGAFTPGSYVLASNTATNRRPGVDETVIRDEDLPTTNAATLSASDLYNKFFLTGTEASPVANFTGESTEIVKLATNQPYYNQLTGGSWTDTLMGANQYQALFLYEMPVCAGTVCQTYRRFVAQGQTQGNLSTIQALTPSNVNLGDLTNYTPEIICIGKIIIQYVAANWVITSVENLTGTRTSQVLVASGSGLTAVATNTTLTGNGTVGSPLGVIGAIDSTFNIDDETDATKELNFSVGGNTTGVKTTIATAQTTAKTYTMQDVASSNFVMSEGTQTINGAKTFGTVPTLPAQTANTLFAGPVSGSTAVPAFRALVTDDLPQFADLDNMAQSFSNCSATLLAETRTNADVTLSYTDATPRTLRYWAYQAAQTALANAATVLFGAQSYQASVTNIGEFIETPLMVIPPAYAGKALNVSFLLNTGAATTTTDYTVYVIRYNSSRVYQERITVQGANFLGIDTWTGFFLSGSTSTDLYSVMVYSNVTPTIVFTVDNFYVGMKQMPVGMAGTDLVEFIPTFVNITGTAKKGFRQQLGDRVHYQVSIQCSNTAGAGTYVFNYPTSDVVDIAKLANINGAAGSNALIPGVASLIDTSTGETWLGSALVTATGLTIYGGNSQTNWSGSTNVPDTLTTNHSINIDITLPIVGLSSGVTMLNSDRVKSVVRYTTNVAQNLLNNTATIIDFEDIEFDTKVEVTTGAAWKFTANTAGYYSISAQISLASNAGWEFGEYILLYLYKNVGTAIAMNAWTAPTGTIVSQVSVTSLTYLNVGDYVYVSAIQNSDGTIALNGNKDTNFINIEQLTDRDALAGLPISTQNIVGRTDGVAPAAGFIGETIECSNLSSTTGIGTAYQDLTGGASITLTPGRWELCYSLTVSPTTGALAGNTCDGVVVITDSANALVPKTTRLTEAKTTTTLATTVTVACSASAVVNISVATTYKIRAKRIDINGTNSFVIYNGTDLESHFYAKRIA